MSSKKIMYRTLKSGISLTYDLAGLISDRLVYGEVAVLTERPLSLLSATRKQWLKKMRRLQCQRAASMDRATINDLTAKIIWMQQMRFTAVSTGQMADVYFGTAEELTSVLSEYMLLCVATVVAPEELRILEYKMPKKARVIIYECCKNNSNK